VRSWEFITKLCPPGRVKEGDAEVAPRWGGKESGCAAANINLQGGGGVGLGKKEQFLKMKKNVGNGDGRSSLCSALQKRKLWKKKVRGPRVKKKDGAWTTQ